MVDHLGREVLIGDAVVATLNSFGPTMTVFDITQGGTVAMCNWLVEGTQMRKATYPIRQLIKVPRLSRLPGKR